LTVVSSDELTRAAQLMVEHEVSHLIVIERRSRRPFGVISTLDIARVPRFPSAIR
jgi:CBS domain-containing protein